MSLLAVPAVASSDTATAPSAAPSPSVTAPADTAPPTISGHAREGATLTASAGAWTNAPTGYAEQWERCPPSGGACLPIAGASSPSHMLTGADAGHALVVLVAARNAAGTGAAIASAQTLVVAASTAVRLVVAHPTAVVATRLTVIVSSGSVNVRPAGTVTVRRGSRPVAGCVGLRVAGTARTLTVHCRAHLDAGRATLRAAFTPAARRPLMRPPAVARAVAIRRVATTTRLRAPARATIATRLTYSARVGARGAAAPSVGRVVFVDRGHRIAGCAARRVHAGIATCSVRAAHAGRRRIAARYTGARNFAASVSSRVRETIAPPPALDATIGWTFHFTPRYTTILALALRGAPPGARLALRCAGRGCPFATRTRRIGRGRRTLDLARGLRNRRLRVHATLTISITRDGDVGKYYRFIVRARRQPKILISCLAPGSRRPGVNCRAR